jgi:hypothetical protein
MSANMACELPFWKDPGVLFRHFSLQYKPTCKHYVWNFIVRILLLSLCLGLVASALGGLSAIAVTLLFGGITAAAIILTSSRSAKGSDTGYQSLPFETTVYPQATVPRARVPPGQAPGVADPPGYIAPIKEKFEQTEEHFVNGGSAPGSVQPFNPMGPMGVVEVDASPYSGAPLPLRTLPSSRNLFMNVLLDEIKYNPDRPEAAAVNQPAVKQTLDDYFRIQWFSDPTDVFGKNQSQRQFVTQPSTTVPNDQGAFADWLYRIPGKTCKEGGREACLSGTDGGPIPWLNQAS